MEARDHALGTSSAPVSMEEATIWIRLYVEHTAYLQGHDTLPWSYNEFGVATTVCEICGKTGNVFYRANRQPTYAHDFHSPCAGRSVAREQ